jgi:alkane 1-monooxygenase
MISTKCLLEMKIFKKLGYLFPFILPTLWVWGNYQGGFWQYSAVIFAFGLVPIIDFLVGIDRHNFAKEEEKQVLDEWYYKGVLYLWAFVQGGLLLWACYVVAFQHLSSSEYVGFLLSAMTVLGGIGITVAHELGHKNNRFEQFLAKAILNTVFYRHFFIEHNRGHHVHVATPSDPATSRKNQSFYAFWWQSVTGSIRNAWNLEKKRLERKGKSVWSAENEMWACLFQPLALMISLTALFSLWKGEFLWQVPVFFLSQSVLSFSLLEAVNYIEHYGIMRRQLPNGKYERVEHLHSWNASHLISNFFLFQLQRHSDHHAYANRPYQVLRHFEDSPQLPAGYPTMIITALFPPLWFALMNKRLERWQQQNYATDSFTAKN